MYWKKPELNDENTFRSEPEAVEAPAAPTASGWDVQNAYVNEFITNFAGFGVSDDLNRDRVYREKNKKIFDVTGEELPNPQQSVYGLSYPWMDDDTKARAAADFDTYKADGGDLSWGGYIRDRWSEQEWRRRAEKALEKHPELRDEILDPLSIQEQGFKIAREASERALETWERSDKGLGAWAGWGFGGLQGQLVDPAFYMAMPLSFGGAGVGAKGLLVGAAKAAGVNMGAQALVEPSIASYQRALGNQYGLLEMATSVGMAGVFGAGVDAAGRAAWRGGRKVFGYEPVVQDGIVVGYYRPEPEAAPLTELPPITPELQERLKAGDETAEAEIMKELGIEGGVPASVMTRAAEGDVPALAKVLDREIEADPVLRQTVDAAIADETLATKPIPDMPDADHARIMMQSLRAVGDPDHEPVPRLVGDEPIAPGNYANLVKELGEVRARLEGVENPAELEARVADLEAQIRTIDTFGRDPVGDALRLRENPGMLTQDFDLAEPKVQQVRALARLSDEGFAMVQEGRIKPALAATVSDFVEPELHARVLQDLARRPPVSPEDARAMIAELLRSPDYTRKVEAEPGPVPAAAGSPRLLDDPYGSEAKQHLQALEQQFSEEMKAAGGEVTPQAIDAVATAEGRVATLSRSEAVRASLEELLPVLPPKTTLRVFDRVDQLPPTLAGKVRAANALKFRRALDRYTQAQSSTERLVAADLMRQANRLEGVEGMADDDVVWIASYAMDPKAVLKHEAIHALRRAGVLAPDEVKLLGQSAREAGLFTSRSEDQYRQAYGNRGLTREALDDLIDEEAAAHYLQAAARGEIPADVAPQLAARGIADRIKEFFARIREILTGQGYRVKSDDMPADPARDVVDAILSGEVARREVKAEWMRNNPEAVELLREANKARKQVLKKFMDDKGYTSMALMPQRTGEAPTFGRVVTPDGSATYPIRYEIVDLATLKKAEGDLQPRDRDQRAASQAQIDNIAANLNGDLLLYAPQSDRGAPIVDENGVVLSGNARRAAIELAKRKHPERYQAYLDVLKREGFKVDGIETPVLVRRLETLDDNAKRAFAVASNKDDKLAMSPSEQARVDRDLMTDDVLMRLDPEGEAGLGSAGNREFVRAVMRKIPPAERAAFQDEDGLLTPAGVARLEGGIFARAYDDRTLVNRIIEDQDGPGIRNALIGAAPAWAQMRAVSPEYDITPNLVEAIGILNRLKETRVKVDDYFAQQDAFSRVAPETETITRMFFKEDGRRAPWRDTRDALKEYARKGSDQANSVGDLLGAKPTPREILDGELAKMRAGIETPTLFAFASEMVADIDRLSLFSPHPEGKRIRAYHATTATFDQFDKSKSVDFGVHFGTSKQASRIVRTGQTPLSRALFGEIREGARTLPVELDVKKPLTMPDLNNWDPVVMMREAQRKGVKFDTTAQSNILRMAESGQRQAAYQVLERAFDAAGYDSIRYRNGAEGVGWSYIVWNKGQVRSAYNPDMVLFAFAGENARNANKITLSMAKTYEKSGLDREAIWRRTGWFRGVDQKWRFETDDSIAKLGESRYGYLVDVLDNPEVFKNYPDMQGIAASFRHRVGLDTSSGGHVPTTPEAINVQSPTLDDLLSVGLHEMQHGIQLREGFAYGGSPSDFRSNEIAAERQYLMKLQDMIPHDTWMQVGNLPGDMSDRQVATMLYAKIAGEVEARTVQKRAKMTAAERAARPPWKDYDIPERKQIVRFHSPEKARAEFRADAKKALAEGAELPDGTKISGLTLFKFADSGEGKGAYHGTPWRFDRFSLSAIGSGEGAQVYGHGLYFASNRKVAEWYRDTLTKRHNVGRPLVGVTQVVAIDGRKPNTGDFKTRGMRNAYAIQELDAQGSFEAWDKYMRTAIRRTQSMDPSTAREMIDAAKEVREMHEAGRLSWRAPQKGDALLIGGKPLPQEDHVFASEVATEWMAELNRGLDANPRRFWETLAETYEEEAKYAWINWRDRAGGVIYRNLIDRDAKLNAKRFSDEAKRLEGLAKRARTYAKENASIDLPEEAKGTLYEVYLKVDDEDLLDWDAPLSKQPAAAMPVIMKLIEGEILEPDEASIITAKMFGVDPPVAKGWDLDEDTLGGLMKTYPEKKPEQQFLAAGIRGLKYLDGSSRNRGAGKHNYVIFDEDVIEIAAVNGVPVRPMKESTLFSMTEEKAFDERFLAGKKHGAGVYTSARGPGYGYTGEGAPLQVQVEPSRLLVWDSWRQPDEVRRAVDVLAATHKMNLGGFPRGMRVYKALSRKLGSDEAASQALREAGLQGHSVRNWDGYTNTVIYDPDLVTPDPRAGDVSRETLATQGGFALAAQVREALEAAGARAPIEEADTPLDQITLPIDPNATPAEKLEAVRALTAENKPVLDAQLADLDAKLGTKSNANVKADQTILEKASRPSILAKKPWHGVEHIRDTLRFQTKIKTFDQIEKAASEMLANGYRIVKIDTEKMLEPKEWGWRFAGFDLRAPNGQLIEWYLIFDQMYAAKKTGHVIFEKWRNLSESEIKGRLTEYYADQYASQKLYREAFEEGLRASGFAGLEDAAESISKLSASLPEIAAKFSAKSSGMTTPASSQAAESLARNLAEPLAEMMSARPDDLSSRTSGSDMGGSPSDKNVSDPASPGKGSGEDVSTQGLYPDGAPTLFSMTNEDGRMKRGALRRAKALKLDIDQIKADMAAAAIDEREALQRKRATYLNARAEEAGLDDAMRYRSPRGQEDVAVAFLRMHESLGLHAAPFKDLVSQREVLARQALEMMGNIPWELRKGALLGDVRRVKNKAVQAQMGNMIREAAGEKTGDAMAAGMAKSWLQTAEWLRQRFNANGGDIGKLPGWYAPQYHDPERWLAAGRDEIVNYFMKDGVLNRDMMRSRAGARLSDAELRALLREIWTTVTTDGANKQDIGDGFGRGALYKQHAEHRVLHFKNADAYLAYVRDFGGADPYAMMIGHINMMTRDISALERFGANPEVVRERIKEQIILDAKNAKSARSVYDDLSDHVSDLKSQVAGIATPVDKAMKRLSDLHQRLDEIRGKPRYDAERQKLQTDLVAANQALTNAMQPGASDPASAAIIQKILATIDEMDEIARTQSVLSRNPEERARRILGRADEVWKLYMGHTNVPVDGRIAGGLSNLRNIISSSLLIRASLSAITDQATSAAARAFIGMPVAKQLGSFIRGFSQEDRKFAMRAGLGLDQAMHAFATSQRFYGMVNTSHVTGYIADRTHAFSGLAPMTQAMKTAFGSDFMAWMADLASGTPWSGLEPWARQMMDRHGFTEADYTAMRSARPEQHRGVPRMTRAAVEQAAGPEAAERYMRMLLRERSMAVLEPTLQGRTAIISETRPGTIIGEMARSGAMLKSFPTSYMMLVMGRFYHQALAGRAFAGNTVRAGAAIFVIGTLMGALAMQLKSIAKLQDPQPMDNLDFWKRAFFQAGGIGIYGDFIDNALSRNERSLSEVLAGPMVAEIDMLANLTLRNIGQFGRGEPTNMGREIVNYIRQRTPGAIVPFYLRPAYDRWLLDELQNFADPEAYRARQRQMRNQKRIGGNDFFWPPGQPMPERGPDLGAAFGSQ